MVSNWLPRFVGMEPIRLIALAITAAKKQAGRGSFSFILFFVGLWILNPSEVPLFPACF